MSAGNLPGDVEIADSELFFIFSMFLGLLENIPPVKAYETPLAMLNASSISVALMIATTGPNISSWAILDPGFTSVKMAGPTKYPSPSAFLTRSGFPSFFAILIYRLTIFTAASSTSGPIVF